MIDASANEQDSVEASYFMEFYDEEFLQEAYRHLLKREIDPAGLASYLRVIRSGESKYQILYNLSRSKECKGTGIVVLGLLPYRCMKMIRSVPILGRVVQTAVFLWRIDTFLKDLRALENHVYRLSTKIKLR